MDISGMMKVGITRKQAGDLMKKMKELNGLSYESFDSRRETEFKSYLITSLMELQTEISAKEKANQFIDLNDTYYQVLDMIDAEIDYINSVKEINERLGITKRQGHVEAMPNREEF